MQKSRPYYRHRWEVVFTATLTLAAVVMVLLPLFIRFMPELLTGLIIASLIQALIGGILPLWTIVSGLGRHRLKYILNSAFPFLVSVGIGLLSILLMQGSGRLASLYSRFLEAYQGISNNGIDSLVASLLVTGTNLHTLWPILCQFGAVLLSWGLLIGNGFLAASTIRQIYRFDGAVTFARMGLVWLLAGLLVTQFLAGLAFLG